MRFTIPVAPITKKNHQNIVWNKRTKRPMVIPSPQYIQYEKAVSVYIPRRKQPIDQPVNVCAVFYVPTRRKCDLTNLEQALADVLVKYRLIADDNYSVIVSWDGSRVMYSPDYPRTEVIITEAKDTFRESERSEQQRSDAKIYKAHGKSLTIQQWADELGLTVSTLRKRLKNGMTAEEAFVPDKRRKKAEKTRQNRLRGAFEKGEE